MSSAVVVITMKGVMIEEAMQRRKAELEEKRRKLDEEAAEQVGQHNTARHSEAQGTMQLSLLLL